MTHASLKHGILGGSALKPFWSQIYGPEKKLKVSLSLSHMFE